MNKNKLIKLALMGITSGMFISAAAANTSNATTKEKEIESSSQTDLDKDRGNITYHLMTEKELMFQLSPDGVGVYKSLSPEGKILALKVASQSCNGTNECKGLNACQSDKNDCAGKGSCKGLGKCAFSDKNLAVKTVSKNMEEKRQSS